MNLNSAISMLLQDEKCKKSFESSYFPTQASIEHENERGECT